MTEDEFHPIFNIVWFASKWSEMQWNEGTLSDWPQFWRIMEIQMTEDEFCPIFNIVRFTSKWSEMQRNEGMLSGWSQF